MNKIKILHVHTLPVISGSGINTYLTMVGLDRHKFEVEFACAPGGRLVDKAIEAGIKFQPVNNFVQAINPLKDLAALFELISIIRKERYTIVHTHNSKAGFIGRLAAKITRTPIIVHTIHGFSFHEFETSLRKNLFLFLERMAAPWADKLITISEYLRTWGLKELVGKEQQYVTIYSGIEIDKFNNVETYTEKTKRELGIKPHEKVIGLVAKLWEGKGHEIALKAFSDIHNAKLVIVGDGYLKQKLEKLTDELGMKEKVVFTGFREDVPELISIFDIQILPSFFEGMGRVILEGMAAGKPVIATRVGGIVDLVEDSVNGLLIEPNNVEALRQTMIKLLDDAGLRKMMGEAGRLKVTDKFTAEVMVRQIQQVYEELLNSKGIL